MARYMVLVESASVNAQDNAGWTPLHEACSNCNTKLAEMLLQNGADANISSRDGTRWVIKISFTSKLSPLKHRHLASP